MRTLSQDHSNSQPAVALGSLAAQINTEHALAVKSAETAIEHALEAGRLLLQAREQVGHGEWLEWAFANLEVSERQAQRYMRAARNTTRVSHLPSLRAAIAELAAPRPPKALPAPDLLPKPVITVNVESGSLTLGTVDGEPIVVFQESQRHPGFWHCLDLRDGSFNGRPIRADAAGWLLNSIPEAERCEWHLIENAVAAFNAEAA